ncbi:MAG: hypothetical protein WCW16_05175 [Candidatus Magasanikbacteria bacterium]
MHMTSTRKNILVFLLLLGVVFSLYYRSLFFGFLSDDYHFLYITSLQDSVLKYFNTNNVGEASGGSYGPVWNVLFTIEYLLFHLNAVFYHLVSLILYTLTAFIIYLWLTKLSHSKIIGFISSVLFIILPGHIESVSWIAVQPHVFATFFAVLALYFYYEFIETKKKNLLFVSVCAYVLSVFTKETAIMLPFVVLLMECFFGRWDGILGTFKRLVIRLLPFGLFTLLFVWLRYRIVGYVFGYYAGQGESIGLVAKLKTFVEIATSHVISYPYRQSVSEWFFRHDMLFVLSILAILGIMIFVMHKEYRKIAWFLLGAYVILSYPFLSLQLNPVNNEGERYGYFVSIFFVMWVGVVLYGVFIRVTYGKWITWGIVAVASIFLLYQIPSKLHDYTLASRVRDQILDDFRSFNFKNNYYTLIVGLPDNVAGAPVFRNAIKEAVYLTSDRGFFLGERIPLYTELGKSRVGKNILALEQNEYSYQLVPINNLDKSIFTGFATYKHELANFSMENFVRLGFKGEGITIDVRDDVLKTYTEQEKQIILAFFDGEKMNFFEVK